MKKLLALILALVLVLSLAACAPADNDETTSGKDETTAAGSGANDDGVIEPLFKAEDNVVITLYMPNNSDLETEGCYANLAIEKVTNATVNITEYNEQNQYDTLIAEKKIPALTYSNGTTMGPTYGPIGAYVDWNTVLDQMPNAKAVLSDEKWAEDVAKYTDADGHLWQLPIPQTGYASIYGYIYRQDILEKHDLEFPDNQEDFYDLLVELKGLYPNSYPFVMRQMSDNMQGLEAFAYPWGTNHQLLGYYNTIMKFDHDTETYYFAQTSDAMKECVAWLHQLTEEGLMHPSSLSLDTQGWTEALATDQSFISYDKMDRIPALMAAAEGANPDFLLTGAAPIAMGTNGAAESKQGGPTTYSWLLAANISDEEKANTIAYVDWLYSDDGILVTNWGIKGESYDVDENGNRYFLDSFTYAGSGLGVCSQCAYRDFDAYVASLDESVAAGLEVVQPYAVSPADPMLTYTEDQQYDMDTYCQSLYDASLANIQKFILGQRDIETEWEDHIAEMEALNLDKLLKIHQDAYERLYG